jgi:hypothetical protein
MHLQSIDNEFDCHLMAHHTIFMGDLNYRLTRHDATPDRILAMITGVVNNNLSDSTIKRGQVFSHDPVVSGGSFHPPKLQLSPHQVSQGLRRSSTPSSIVEDGDGDDRDYLLANTPLASSGVDTQAMDRLPAPPSRPSAAAFPTPCDAEVASPFAPSVSSVSGMAISWRSLLEHDELKQCMDDGVIFTDFDEAKIAFPPTYRRVLNRTLDVHQFATVAGIAHLYTTLLGDGMVRVPSYTDRILYHSLPNLQVCRTDWLSLFNSCPK